MEKNIQSYNKLCEELEINFKKLGYKYKKIDLDEDANYMLSIGTEKSGLESIRKLKTIDGVVIYVDVADYSLNIIATNVYKINRERDINTYYKLVNNVNNIIDHGRFSLYAEKYSILYRSTIEQGEGSLEKKIKNIVDEYLGNLAIFYVCKKKMEEDEWTEKKK